VKKNRGKILFAAGGALLLLGAAAFFCFRRNAPPNLILVSIDTLRADRIGCYGYQTETSPVLDRLAREATVFTRAIVQSPWTLPSHMSLLTSLYPSTHGVGGASRRLGAAVITLPEILREAGYATAGFVDAHFLAGRYGFRRGFDTYRNSKGKGLATILPEAENWLREKRREPFFLFFHVFDCHCPYTPPEEVAARFSPDYSGELDLAGRCGVDGFPLENLSAADIRYIGQQYDGEIYALDGGLERLWDFLRKEGLLENTVLVVTSDHGEEFMEHGRIGHTRSVYHELLHVPLLIRLPGKNPPGRTIGETVLSLDIAPTLLELAGLPVPETWQGRSLIGELRGEGGESRPAYSELNELARKRSLIEGNYHYILDLEDGAEEVYDLTRDRREENNLAKADPELARRLRARMLRIAEAAERAGASYESGEVKLDGKTRRELQALGYLQ